MYLEVKMLWNICWVNGHFGTPSSTDFAFSFWSNLSHRLGIFETFEKPGTLQTFCITGKLSLFKDQGHISNFSRFLRSGFEKAFISGFEQQISRLVVARIWGCSSPKPCFSKSFSPQWRHNLTSDSARKRNATFLSSHGTLTLKMRNIFWRQHYFYTTARPDCGIDKKLNFQPLSWALINILHQTSKVEFYLCLFHSTFIKVSDNRTTHKKKTSRSDKRVTRMLDS